MKFRYHEFLDIAWKWSQNCSNKRYSSSEEFYKKKYVVEKKHAEFIRKYIMRILLGPPYIPGRMQQFQLSPCYIQPKRQDGDQYFEIPEAYMYTITTSIFRILLYKHKIKSIRESESSLSDSRTDVTSHIGPFMTLLDE